MEIWRSDCIMKILPSSVHSATDGFKFWIGRWLGSGGTMEGGDKLGGSGSLGVCALEKYTCPIPFLSLSLLPGQHEASSCIPPFSSAMLFCLTMAQKSWSPVTMDWNLWNHEPKQPFLHLIVSSTFWVTATKSLIGTRNQSGFAGEDLDWEIKGPEVELA
jgi:hypothetical protein